MPIVQIQLAGNLTNDQKKIISEKFTKILQEVAGKDPSRTAFIFQENAKENWYWGDRVIQ